MAPQSDWLHSDYQPRDAAAPQGVERINGDPAAAKLALSISEALSRALTAKFFATLDAEQQIRNDMRALCRDAQEKGVQVEALIIAIKEAWHGSTEARTLPKGTQGPDLLTRIITLCISEYYSASRSD